MRTHCIRLALPLILLCASVTVLRAQRVPFHDRRSAPEISPSPTSRSIPELVTLKKPGHYTASDWRQLIDTLWGPGSPTVDKLTVFDTYWNQVDQTWGGFPNLAVNWDSLKNVYRPLVAAGVTRGRFYGILSRMTRALNEWHVYMKDNGIDATMGYYSDDDGEFPNYPSFHYQAGVPILSPILYRTNFGAGITCIQDSIALVYSVMPNHPLNLQPGDVILGYDGVPWNRLIKELYDAELPIAAGDQGFSSSPAAFQHCSVMCAGLNWGLFDTIDVLKYSTNDTLHYPTSLLKALAPPYFIATEQLPVSGVPTPDIQSSKLVSWGVIQGTSIGYIYALDWWGGLANQTGILFGQAVDDLMHTKKVRGLILDFRTNFGGDPSYANTGFSQLFNSDPTLNYSSAYRVPGSDHFRFNIQAPWASDFFTPTAEIFDHPIAVLTGPNCGSAGDYNAFRMRFHPMARIFGKATTAAFTNYTPGTDPTFAVNSYSARVDNGSEYSNYDNEGYLIHKGFPVDEEIWLTREGVAKGVDDVVQRALSWITTLSYAHDVHLVRRGIDTLGITAQVENPLSHTIHVTATLTSGSGNLIDSLSLFDDGQHGDGAAGDGLWAYQYVPAKDDTISLAIRTDDLSLKSSRTLPAVARYLFTRNAIISMDPSTLNLGTLYEASIDTSISVKNVGYASDSLYVTLQNIDVNPDSAIAFSPTAFALAAGDSQKVIMHVRPNLLPPSFYYADIVVTSRFAYGQKVFKKLIGFEKVSAIAQQKGLPKKFTLAQNFPNPFNPSTTIQYALPRRSHATLSVYNTLGQCVSRLVDGLQEAGFYEVKFSGTDLSSGVYFYRIQAGSYVKTMKLILLK